MNLFLVTELIGVEDKIKIMLSQTRQFVYSIKPSKLLNLPQAASLISPAASRCWQVQRSPGVYLLPPRALSFQREETVKSFMPYESWTTLWFQKGHIQTQVLGTLAFFGLYPKNMASCKIPQIWNKLKGQVCLEWEKVMK